MIHKKVLILAHPETPVKQVQALYLLALKKDLIPYCFHTKWFFKKNGIRLGEITSPFSLRSMEQQLAHEVAIRGDRIWTILDGSEPLENGVPMPAPEWFAGSWRKIQTFRGIGARGSLRAAKWRRWEGEFAGEGLRKLYFNASPTPIKVDGPKVSPGSQPLRLRQHS